MIIPLGIKEEYAMLHEVETHTMHLVTKKKEGGGSKFKGGGPNL